MRPFSFLVVLVFAFIASSHAFPSFPVLEARKGGDRNGTSKGNGTRGNSIERTCKHMAKLTKLTDLANNQTKLDALVAKGKLTDAKVESIKAKAADSSSQLQAMTSNTTLVGECVIVNAHRKDVKMCREMAKLTKLAALKDNQSAMDAFLAKKGMNSTQATRFQEIIGNATTTLQELSSNTTLADFCAQQKRASGSQAVGTPGAEQSNGGVARFAIQTISYTFLPALTSVLAFVL